VPRDWDAPAYERISTPQEEMGRAVLARMDLRGDETVVDAGCGTGRVTALLLERLPQGRVIAVDGSPAMIDQARERLPADRVEFVVADLAGLRLDAPADAVLSTATFHWVPDHEALFGALRRSLRDGGRLAAQCGGRGNIQTVVDAVDRVAFPELAGWTPWNFAGPEETEERLRAAGFSDARCWLEEWPVTIDEPHGYFATVTLGSHLERLPEDRREAFVQAVVDDLEDPLHLDYVRLNIDARAY
jgi:trans-aconitate 2-methyltransferase